MNFRFLFCQYIHVYYYADVLCMYTVSYKVRKATEVCPIWLKGLSLVFHPGFSEFIMCVNFVFPIFDSMHFGNFSVTLSVYSCISI